MPMIFSKEYKGFTLIELLIVIAIIGILSVAFLPVLRGSTGKARDAARVAAVNDMLTAIENAYSVEGTAIPMVTAGVCLDFTGGAGEAGTAGESIKTAVGRAPKAQSTGSDLCAGGGYYYRTYKSGGTPTGALETALNFVLAVEVELTENGNTETLGAELTDKLKVDAVTGTISAARNITDGTPSATAPFVYMGIK